MPAIKPSKSKLLDELNEDGELDTQRIDIMIDSIHRMAHCGDNGYWLRLQEVLVDFLKEQVYNNGEEVSVDGEPHFGYETFPDEYYDPNGLFDENQKHFCMYFRVKDE